MAGLRGPAAVGLLVVVVPLVTSRLPHTPWLKVDVLLGFGLAVAPVLGLSWLLATRPLSSRAAGVLAAAGLAAAVSLSGLGWVGAAPVFKVLVAALAGRLLGRQVAEAWWLVLVALVALLADTWSVFAGPTRLVVERAPSMLDYLLLHFPALGSGAAGMGLGMSDLVFLALFTAGSHRAGLRARAGFLAMGLSLLLTVVLALVWKPALPALPLLSLAFLGANADRLWALRPRANAA